MSSLLPCPHGRSYFLLTFKSGILVTIRNASTTSAIKRGLRAEQEVSKSVRGPRGEKQAWRRPGNAGAAINHIQQNRTRQQGGPASTDIRRNSRSRRITDGQRREPQARRISQHQRRDPQEGRIPEHHAAPVSIPRTTAASTYIYGFNSVIAALKARRRKLYTLFTGTNRQDAHTARALTNALPKGLVWNKFASPELLDAMSEGRPHNGVCLEASALPAPPVLGLGLPKQSTGDIPLTFAYQNAEDATINGTSTILPTFYETWRRPFILMLDGILDPQNVGNILRTAHFYGVDAVAISTNTCCPLTSAAMAKASSGACEAVPILALPKPSDFLYASHKAGWKIYAAMPEVRHTRTAQVSHVELSLDSPLSRDPVILMLGAEGEGLRDNLKQKADYLVNISRYQGAAGGKGIDVGVDSINVGTAAAVLIDSFLREPVNNTPPVDENNRLF